MPPSEALWHFLKQQFSKNNNSNNKKVRPNLYLDRHAHGREREGGRKEGVRDKVARKGNFLFFLRISRIFFLIIGRDVPQKFHPDLFSFSSLSNWKEAWGGGGGGGERGGRGGGERGGGKGGGDTKKSIPEGVEVAKFFFLYTLSLPPPQKKIFLVSPSSPSPSLLPSTSLPIYLLGGSYLSIRTSHLTANFKKNPPKKSQKKRIFQNFLGDFESHASTTTPWLDTTKFFLLYSSVEFMYTTLSELHCAIFSAI